MLRRGVVCALLALATGARATAAPAAPQGTAPAGVLVLYADDRFTYAIEQVDQGFRAGLAAEPERPVRYYTEFMEAVRFPEAHHREALRQFLADKYRDSPPAVVVAAGRPALQFLIDHRLTLFPGVPIIHEGLMDAEVPQSGLDAATVGITGSWDLLNSLTLALRLQPDTRRVVVINGVSQREAMMLGTLPREAERLKDRLAFTWLTRHTLDEIKAAVAALPDGTVVLFASLMEDAAGVTRIPRDVLETLAAVSSAPIYGPFESYVGHGIVGSTVETWHTTGYEAARLALRILAGEAPRDAVRGRRMPVSTIVDWRQATRWGLVKSDFPAGTVVRFREPTLWESHRTLVLVFAGIGVTQLALIAALGVALQRRRLADATRLEAQARVSRLRGELAHATRVTMLGELAAALAHEVNQPLAAILSNAQATRRWLDGASPDPAELRAALDDIIADDKRAGEIVHRMRALLKKAPPAAARVDLNKAVADVAALLNSELVANDITLRLDVPATPIAVRAAEVEVQQILLNLLLNAIQAIRDHGAAPRVIRVEARHAGDVARVTVQDSGPGLSPEARARLFEPFFTTKARGLGMGLAICRRIAEAYGGTLQPDAAASVGAAFVVTLPVDASP